MREALGKLPGRSGFPWWSPLGIGLLLGFLLPILVLAAVSTISIRQRADTRRLLVQERYLAVADLVSTKLDEEMDAWHRELLEVIDGDDWSEAAVVERVRKAEEKFAFLRPLLMLATEGRVIYPLRSRASTEPGAAIEFGVGGFGAASGTFGWLVARAEEAELRDDNGAAAVRLYERAVRTAPSTEQRVRALNGLARTQLNGRQATAALHSYERIIELANPLDVRLGRWAISARLQIASAEAQRGRTQAVVDAQFAALDFVQQHRFHLDPDLYAFYRAEVERGLKEHELGKEQRFKLENMLAREPELEDIDTALQGLVRQVPRLLMANATDWGSTAAAATAAADAPTHSAERTATEWTVRYLDVQQDTAGPTVLSLRQGSDWQLVRRWRPASVKRVLYSLLESDGPWTGQGIGLQQPSGELVFASTENTPPERVVSRLSIAALPGWHIFAYPIDSSLAAEARQDVVEYSVLLGAGFLAVVASLVLATRTLSREVALARTRSDFVSNVSHELKTPLALIRMFAENLRSGWVPEDKRPEYYKVMLGESERLSGVIDNVLDFSRIESGRRSYQFRATDLTELVTDIVTRYRYSFETAGIGLDTDLPDTPVESMVDRDGVALVIVNLLSNAAKYIGDGDKDVRVSLHCEDGCAVLSVRDTGVGMAKDVLDEIFAPFRRIDDPAIGSVAGSGIGLTIVKHIVAAHGGSVSVESAPAAGSTFRVTLPLDAPRPAATNKY